MFPCPWPLHIPESELDYLPTYPRSTVLGSAICLSIVYRAQILFEVSQLFACTVRLCVEVQPRNALLLAFQQQRRLRLLCWRSAPPSLAWCPSIQLHAILAYTSTLLALPLIADLPVSTRWTMSSVSADVAPIVVAVAHRQ